LHLRPRGTTAKTRRERGPGGQGQQAAAREHEDTPGCIYSILAENTCAQPPMLAGCAIFQAAFCVEAPGRVA
jgi:hypothetical protein